MLSTTTDQNGNPYEFANLEHIALTRGVGLPAFTSDLPDISVTLDMDEYNVVGTERDVMLESWFFDTSANASTIGRNSVSGKPLANTLNNIVGIGHSHFPELDNTLLEMMVHIGALSPHDISGAKNNPGQNQLTENYSGKDFDLDGIDDHFDVDSHLYLGSTNPDDPSPGIYSSGIDANSDGIDDADVLPIVIGDFAYSIWYGESFLSPIVIFSRETNASLSNNFDPQIADMNLSDEGELVLPWNDFLNYTLQHLEHQLQTAGVHWASGTDNPFPKMSAPAGAIGGIEFGVEPQINAPSDLPYTAVINKLEININGSSFGLNDTAKPTAQVTNPYDGADVTPRTMTLAGISSDTDSGTSKVRVRIQQLGTSPSRYWNGSTWSDTPTYNEAVLDNFGTSWTLPDVDLSNSGRYRVRLITHDFAGNISRAADIPKSDFLVGVPDTTKPTGMVTWPANGNTIPALPTNITGTATDTGSGVNRVRVRVQQLDVSPARFWDGINWGESSTYLDAELDASGATWVLPGVDFTDNGRYRIRLVANDNSGNISRAIENPGSDLFVGQIDTTKPTATITLPTAGSALSAGAHDITGNWEDTESGINRVGVRIQRLKVTPALFWNGLDWTPLSTYLDAAIDQDNTSWTLPAVNLTETGNYRVRLVAYDKAGNVAKALENPKSDFTVN